MNNPQVRGLISTLKLNSKHSFELHQDENATHSNTSKLVQENNFLKSQLKSFKNHISQLERLLIPQRRPEVPSTPPRHRTAKGIDLTQQFLLNLCDSQDDIQALKRETLSLLRVIEQQFKFTNSTLKSQLSERDFEIASLKMQLGELRPERKQKPPSSTRHGRSFTILPPPRQLPSSKLIPPHEKILSFALHITCKLCKSLIVPHQFCSHLPKCSGKQGTQSSEYDILLDLYKQSKLEFALLQEESAKREHSLMSRIRVLTQTSVGSSYVLPHPLKVTRTLQRYFHNVKHH